MSGFFAWFSEKDEKGLRFWERDLFGKDRQATPVMLSELCQQIAYMMDAGVSIKDALIVLTDNPTKNRSMQINLQAALDGILGGNSLSRSLEETKYFPEFMCNMCRMGELSNDLTNVMFLLADYYGETARNREEIKSVMLYPAIVTVMMLAMILVSVLYVLPHYALMFEVSDVPLPVLTQVLLGISDLLITQWWLVLSITILVIMLPPIFLRTSTGRSWSEYVMLYIPPFSVVYRQMINLHIVQSMSLLLQSNRPLAEAVLAVSSIIQNKKVKYDLQKIVAGLQEGNDFWILISKVDYIDPIVISMARVGAETGNMAQVFNYACTYSRYRFQQMTRRLNKLVEPTITLVLGLILGMVMLSIILPTFAMTELVGY
ncbi:MAG: type II secretion system F family protein [Defluviitaleaceae bacterium]|nr:type II secretion system F family protein [Defluviitaleaceae bacterium]